MTKNVTNSEIQTFKQCRRKWWLAYYRRLGLPAAEVVGPRAVGTRVHAALQAMYGTERVDPVAVMALLIEEDRTRVDELDHVAVKQFETEASLGMAMIEGYVEWVAETGVDQGLTVVGLEERITVPSGVEGVNLMGKLDQRVYREQDGAQLFLDHKTVQSLNESTRLLHLDEQMLHYHLLEFLKLQEEQPPDGVSHRRTDGGLYNMLRKVKRTARATPPFFERAEVRHNVHELRSYFLRVHGEIRAILEVEARLAAGEDPRYVAYPSPTRDCTWKCDFFHVCSMFDDGSNADGYLAATFVEIDPHKRYDTDDDKETP